MVNNMKPSERDIVITPAPVAPPNTVLLVNGDRAVLHPPKDTFSSQWESDAALGIETPMEFVLNLPGL